MSSAQTVRTLALSLVGQRYVLGNEPWYDVGWEPSPDELATDCSGLVYGVFHKAGVKVDGQQLPRLTAHQLFVKAAHLSQPTKCGDLGFLMNASGHVYHTFMFVGNATDDTVVEGGYGGKVRKTTVAVENARKGIHWGRLNTDIEEDVDVGLTDEEHKWLEETHTYTKHLREVVAPQSSYREAINNALGAGLMDEARELNDTYYEKWPQGVSGLPPGWTP